jgi:hypothetical protein
MNALVNSVAILGRPYAITKSRLGAITKVYTERYICDLASLKELFQSIGEKLSGLNSTGVPEFSFLISFSDQTHHDGATADLQSLSTIPIGKQTERIVMRWAIKHDIDGVENELSITVRISNPINPLVYLQAALSKSASEIDNMEFEMGSTCVTVDGATQGYADEIFLRLKNWIAARNKPHAFLEVGKIYNRYEWWIDQLNQSILPLLAIGALSLYISQKVTQSQQITFTPVLIALFFLFHTLGRKLNSKMSGWAKRSEHISLFAITHGDNDAITKMAARAKNSFIKLIASGIFGFILNVAAGIVCWWLVER